MSGSSDLIWVLFGGLSTEHDVSLVSGRQVAAALAAGERRVRPVVIARDGRWRVCPEVFGPGADEAATSKAIRAFAESTATTVEPCEEALRQLRAEAPATVFLALHGPGGEDGAIQGMLEWLGARYTGSGVLASALAMDKIRSIAFFRQNGFTLARGVSSLDLELSERLDAATHARRLAERAREQLSLPVFVKPGVGGSSLGVTLVEEADALEKAVQEALKVSPEALIDERIAGRELTCGVIEPLDAQGRRRRPEALPPTEIRPVSSRYFDYVAKYTPGASVEITPAPLDEETTRRVQAEALRAHVCLGCRGMSRTDFILSEDGRVFILETNTIPGMTPTSLLPQAAAHRGYSFGALCELIVAASLAG